MNKPPRRPPCRCFASSVLVVPPQLPAWRRRCLVAAVAGRDGAGLSRGAAAAGAAGSPRRMVAIQTNLGILPQFFWPEGVGHGLQAVAVPGNPEGLPARDDRLQRRVASGRGRRAREREVVPDRPPRTPSSASFRNSVSLDQVAAERIGTLTRIPVLVTHVGIAMAKPVRTPAAASRSPPSGAWPPCIARCSSRARPRRSTPASTT